MAAVVGIDGHPRGWVAARESGGVITWRVAAVADVATLWSPDDVVGIDIPVGLEARGLRACDRAAQAHLGPAASSVFTTPPRPVLEAHVAADASASRTQALSRELTGQGTTPLALALARRILAVDAVAAAAPQLVEVHPECSFRAIAPDVAFEPKSSTQGVLQRISALGTWLPDVLGVLGDVPPRVPIDDALDALAALWSARRWRAGEATTLPPDAPARPFIAI